MRKILFLILVSIILTQASCSKKGDAVSIDNKNEKLYNVNLSVSTFSTEIVGLNTSSALSVSNSNSNTITNAVGDQINRLEYVIYNSSGIMVKDATQENSLSTFGSISEQLPAGNYKIYVVGSIGQFSLLTKESSTQVFMSPSIYNISDWFVKSIDLTVSDQTQSQSVVLDRVVGKIELQITDAIPSNIAKITISSTSGSWLYLNNAAEPGTEIKTTETSVTSADIGKINFTVSSYVIPSKAAGSITSDVSIRAYNASGGLIVDKIVKDVKVEKNKKTILTGKLFTAPAVTSGLSIGVNADWNVQTNNVAF